MRITEGKDVRDAIERLCRQIDRPLSDTWGCTRHGHLVNVVERLGLVSTAIQEAEVRQTRACREDLVEQLAELAANVVAMLTEEMTALRNDGNPEVPR